jgi:hypothetical protein
LRALVAPQPSITHAPLAVEWQPGPHASAALAAPKIERLPANRTARKRFLMFPPWWRPAPDRPLEDMALGRGFAIPPAGTGGAPCRGAPRDHRPHCSGSGSSLTGLEVGNMLSYSARASRTKRARSSSDLGINRTTSPMCTPRRTFCLGHRGEHHAKHPAPPPGWQSCGLRTPWRIP